MTTTTSTSPARTTLTLQAGLARHRRTAGDAAFAAEAAQAIGATGAYATRGQTYVALTRDGATIGYAYQTYLTILDVAGALPASRQPSCRMASTGHDSQGWDYHLAGFVPGNGGGAHSATRVGATRVGATCPTCWVALPLSGAPCFTCS